MYHYTESGLDNVYLKNGYKIHKTVYGEGVSIENTDGLHKVIGKWLVEMPKPLVGAEVRFLRLEMDQTQRDLAAFIGTTEQTVRLWERNRQKAIPGMADRFLRATYLAYLGDLPFRRMLQRLAQLDQVDHVKGRFQETPTGWKSVKAPPLAESRAC